MPSNKDLNGWLEYSIQPQQLRTLLHPAMWGNGQIELLAELDRSRVSEVVCFGFGAEGLEYGRDNGEEHLIPAVYDAETGKKYLLSSSTGPGSNKLTVTFRPDRHAWRYEFDDLDVHVSLILPRLLPGYLIKVELLPKKGNRSDRWHVYQEMRRFRGMLRITQADHDLRGGRVWFKSNIDNHGEAIGATLDADSVNLGEDGAFFTNIMAKMAVARDQGSGQASCYLARAFGPAPEDAKGTVEGLLSSPERLEAETEEWWNDYVNEVPHLETPDESFSKTFLWSWPDFRMNQIDLPIGPAPPGLFNSNNGRISVRLWVAASDHAEAGAINLLYDPKPQRDLLLFILRETRKSGILIYGLDNGREAERGYAFGLAYFSGLLHKYLLTTGDMALLEEDIGGITFLRRLEDALEAQLAYRDDKAGLYWTDNELPSDASDLSGGSGSLGPNQQAVTRYRGGAGTFYNDSNATIYGTFLAMADIEDLVGNTTLSKGYREQAQDMETAIRKHMWKDDLQFFCDLNKDGTINDYMGIGGFITGLYANQVYRPGGLATQEQAEKLAQWCADPEFASDYGVISLARRSPYFDPDDWKGYNSSFDMHWCNQVPAGLYAHRCYEEAHRQLFKLFRRLGENGGLGPRYRGEVCQADTGEIVPDRFPNYPCILNALTSVVEGVFGLRWTAGALTVEVNSPWPWANLRNLRVRGSMLDLLLSSDGTLSAIVDGKEVAQSRHRKLELDWELFKHVPKTSDGRGPRPP